MVRAIQLVIAALLFAALSLGGQAQRSVATADGAVVRGNAAEKRVGLVFTGHEYAEGGDAILEALRARRAKASFFLTGDFLRRPEFVPLVKRLVAEGHYLGPHSDKHLLYCDWAARRTLVSRAQFEEDLEANLREVARFRVRREAVRYFLPAYEWCNQEIVGWAKARGLVTVNYSPGTRSTADYMEDDDPKFVASETIVESILRAEREDPHGLNGFILLMHIGAGPRRTDKMHVRFPSLLDTLAREQYRFVRIDDLLER